MSKPKRKYKAMDSLTDLDDLSENFHIMECCVEAGCDFIDQYLNGGISLGLYHQWERLKKSIDKALRPKLEGQTFKVS